MTCVCSVGLDMVAIPGMLQQHTIFWYHGSMRQSIGMINNKTILPDLLPVIGKEVGDMVEFGGLLGYAPIMAVNQFSCENYYQKRRRIPIYIHSFKN